MSNSLNSHIIKSQNLDYSQKILDFRFVSGWNTHLDVHLFILNGVLVNQFAIKFGKMAKIMHFNIFWPFSAMVIRDC